MQRKNFSLIELLIVVAIIGALTALILPQFDVSEAEAKDAGCDYSQYGTLRTLTQFRSLNGVYPTGWHTGLTSDGVVMADPKMMDVCKNNVDNAASIAKLSAENIESLEEAGIWTLAADYGKAAVAPVVDTTQVIKVDGEWFETQDLGTWSNSTDPVTFNGKGYATTPDSSNYNYGYDDVVVLFAAPTVDWENYYVNSATDGVASKVGVAQEGKCPWDKDAFSYYMGFFGLKAGAKAKLIGTTCPECGSLNP